MQIYEVDSWNFDKLLKEHKEMDALVAKHKYEPFAIKVKRLGTYAVSHTMPLSGSYFKYKSVFVTKMDK